jgi:hypothetical protein
MCAKLQPQQISMQQLYVYLDNEYYATPKYINHTIYMFTFLNRSVSIIFLALRASKYISGLEGPV